LPPAARSSFVHAFVTLAALAGVAHATPNMDATVVPAGWYGPIVPRTSGDATADSASLPVQLVGNNPATYLNWGWTQSGTEQVARYTGTLTLDGVLMSQVTTPSPATAQRYQQLNAGPVTVRGGRHTLQCVVDPNHLVTETTEADNTLAAQFVWGPLVTSRATPNVRDAPPPAGPFTLPDGDGFKFTRGASFAWVVSMAPRTATDDYDLDVYDDYAGATSGFSNRLARSSQHANATEFVVGHWSGTPYTLYPSATAISGGAGPMYVDQTDAYGHDSQSPAVDQIWQAQSLDAARLADVYEFRLDAGQTYYVTLTRESGPGPLLCAMYSGAPGTLATRADGVVSTQLSAARQRIVYTAMVSGWHPLVVYRDTGTNADQPVTYSLYLGTAGFLDAPAPSAAALALAPPRPNPAAGAVRLDFALPAAGRATLAVYDAGGRRVRALVDATLGAGLQSATWDGRNDAGIPAAPGLYWARLQTESGTVARRVVRVR